MGKNSGIILGVFVLLLLTVMVLAGEPCPFCRRENSEGALYCSRCLRALRWTSKPAPSRFFTVVAREGIDSFIRGPNDGHPHQRSWNNGGLDQVGPVGSYYSPTGLRYLIRFDVQGAFQEAGISMTDFIPEQVRLVLRLAPEPEARDEVPVVVFPLTTPFSEGKGILATHDHLDVGCNWYRATMVVPWIRAGGDFDDSVRCEGVLPASGCPEIDIDVTDIFKMRFEAFRKTGRWDDPGMIMMRDSTKPTHGLYRMIYSFEAAPAKNFRKVDPLVLSPELILR